MEQPHQPLPQQAGQQEQGHAVLRRTLLADLLLPEWLVSRYTTAHLDMLVRLGFSDLASFQSGASPESICLTLTQAGLPLLLTMVIERALEDRQRLQQWQQQQELKEGDVAAGHGSHSGGVGPAAGLRPAAQTPSQGTDAGHARDQQPTCGGGPPAPTSSKGWWSAWLPSAPLQWSTPTPQPQPLHALPPGSATSPPGSAAAAAAAAAATYHNAASTAERRAVFDDAAHSVPIAAPRTAPASTCRRRHVHRPALGQE